MNKKSLQRKVIRERLDYYIDADGNKNYSDEGGFYCTGNIDEMIKSLKKLRTDLKRQYRKWQWFELDYRYEDYEGCSGVIPVGCRWETDEEYAKRIARLKEREAKRKALLAQEKPYICPTCGKRYKEQKYIKGDECPACMNMESCHAS